MTSVHTQTQTKISRSINKTLWVTTAFKHRGYSVKKKSEREREKKRGRIFACKDLKYGKGGKERAYIVKTVKTL